MNKLKYMNNLVNGNIEEIENKFITVVANPPYSTEWSPHTELLKYDDRFKDYGKLAPAKKLFTEDVRISSDNAMYNS